ncbi:M56 family metallopeptidase [Mucilaginibacter sp.]|uniref:M56 family metallopeptidase n=1 Tax=Mucilaginibacter sp. TaxID=1882438 RepID=UPI003D0C8E16
MIPYILHVALLISVCLLFYKVLLQRETFYRLNRVVLVFCLALSFALPLIRIPQKWTFRDSPKSVEAVIQQPIAIDNTIAAQQQNEALSNIKAVKPEAKTVIIAPSSILKDKVAATVQNVPVMQQAIKWGFYLYWMGVAAFGLNLLLQLVVLLYQAYTKPVIKDGRFRIIELTGDKAPCSFGNNIFINPEKYDWETYSQILLHEKVHIQQGHSLDILIAELVLVLQWFNPFAWLYRTELENNLEFLTDDAVLEHKEVEKQSYQMSLLKVSAPHLSLGITTNYNQSLLKKRIVMMNAKKSNIHIMWKYFFLVPLLGVLACALNDPAALAQTTAKAKVKTKTNVDQQAKWSDDDRTEGDWFATIKADKVDIEFKSSDDNNEHNWSSSSTFPLSDFPSLPKDQKGEFSLKREAGTVVFNGKFDGDEGYGHYKFTPDKDFAAFLSKEGITDLRDRDQFSFFMIDIKKDYVAMLKRNGFNGLTRNQLISMAALKVDEPYIQMWKKNGFNDLTPNQLVSGKALHIDGAYVSDIRKAGYTDLTFNQLISFKAQHITGDYINGIKKAKLKDDYGSESNKLPSANELSSFKAMDIDSAYVQSFAAIGYKNIPYRELTTMKSMGITPDFVKGFKSIGYNDLTMRNLVTFKSLNVTPEFIKGYQSLGYHDLTANNLTSLKSLDINAGFIKGFEDIGYKNLSVNNLTTLKALSITPDYIKGFDAIGYKDLSVNQLSSLKALGVNDEYVKSFEAVGYKNIPVSSLTSLKALGITSGYVKGFKDLGFDDIPLSELSSLKATGVTPAYVTEMRGKGFNSKELRKYIQLKNAFN